MLKFYTFFWGGGSKSIGGPGPTGGMGNSNTASYVRNVWVPNVWAPELGI